MPDLKGTALFALDLASPEETEAVLDEVAPDVVVHTAALTEVDRWEGEPEALRIINVEASRRLARWAKARGVRMVFTSTDLVFDGSQGPYREEDPPSPLSRYGLSKAEAEVAVLGACPEALVVRLAVMFGWDGGRGRAFSERFIDSLRAGRAATLYTDEVRSFLYVGAAARALWELAAGGSASGILHLGGGDAMDRYRFGLAMAAHFGLDEGLIKAGSSKSHPGVARPGDVSLVSGRAEELLRMAMPGVAEGLEAMADEQGVLG
jgi:dTDP-4-dehydrorhamnose reductase